MENNNQTNKNKIYAVDTASNFNLVEFEVIKETDKQYVATPISDCFRSHQRTIKKSIMECYDLIFRKTRAEAKILQQELIQKQIERNKTIIEQRTKRNQVLAQLLDKLKEDENNER